MTGQPQHIASLTTTANGSYADGRTMRSADVYTAGSCDWLTKPRKRTREEIPRLAACFSSCVRRGPSPAKTRILRGMLACANAWSKSSGRFQGCSLAQNRITRSSAAALQDARTALRSTLPDCSTHQSFSTQYGVRVTDSLRRPKDSMRSRESEDGTIT